MRCWIIDQLYTLHNTMRVEDAAVVAGYLERQEPLEPWSM